MSPCQVCVHHEVLIKIIIYASSIAISCFFPFWAFRSLLNQHQKHSHHQSSLMYNPFTNRPLQPKALCFPITYRKMSEVREALHRSQESILSLISKAPPSPASDEEKASFLAFLDFKLKGWKNLRRRLDELERKEQKLQMHRGLRTVGVPPEKHPPELQKPLPALPVDERLPGVKDSTMAAAGKHGAYI